MSFGTCFGPEQAQNLRVRADLMIALSNLIEDRDLTQVEAAELFGVSQPGVSDLVHLEAAGGSHPEDRVAGGRDSMLWIR
jgi:predicted XRE-type DNA-binding protein